MKKLLNVFLVIAILYINFVGFIDIAFAGSFNYIGDDVINRIDDSEDVASDLIDKLINWSNEHAAISIINHVISIDFIENLDYSNLDIQLLIDELNTNGYTLAANDLILIKSDIEYDIHYLKESFDIVENYLEQDLSSETVDELDIFYKIRNVFRNLKPSIKNLVRIYYDIYYSELENKINTFDNYSELINLYDDFSGKLVDVNSTYNRFKEELNRLKNIYISKNLSIHEPLFKEELKDYYQTFKIDYDKLYNKLETKLQDKLDKTINDIVDGVDITNETEVINANNQLYEIIDKITEVQNEVDSKFQKFNDFVNGIDIISEYASPYQNQITIRLQEANDYTRSKLLNFGLLLSLINNSDSNIINIDNENGFIIYNSKNLSPSVLINKLLPSYGDLMELGTYNGNIGTKSKIQAYYINDIIKTFTVIVRGDINPDGKIDISDLVVLCDKIYGFSNLDFYKMKAADFDNNDTIDITDLVYLCDKIYE